MAFRLFRRGYWRPILIAAVIFAFGLAVSLVPWNPVWQAMRGARLSLLLMAVILNIAVFPFWVWQWRLITATLTAVRWRSMCGVVALSIIAKVAVSGLAGASSGLLALRYRAGLTYSQATTVISVDQGFALVTKVLVFALAMTLLPLGAVIPQGIVWLSVLAATALVALLLVLCHGQGAPSGRLAHLPETLKRFLRDLQTVGSVHVLAGGMALALVKKSLEIGAALAVQLACGIEASPAAAVLVVAAVSLTTLVPLVPANLGAHSAGVFAAYALLDVPTDRAIAAGVLHHAALLAASLSVSLVGLWLARR